ncbi:MULTISPECIES: AAA family ATPase [Calothrix]|uniref:ATP-binding protein n=2 Tax=Calothrix TaxID=1186 RepID=A0ABR8AH86_9CYAN|nr:MULTISPECIES: AAA family ATPase [Calothrix]MBD2198668.1 ATP-binding protein [Calothrix parietina FACHB-288]MBD2228677.1 ATP-binding protein [Calothrix anomala FACHB-343]
MLNNPDLLTKLYNAFNPFEPLPADDTRYVDCQDVRGDADIFQELGNRMRLANTNTCQLYSGHRGAGKSTELLRLKKYLENRQFYVVYFAADEEDIDSEDAQYTDILLACTRRLLKDLQKIANPRPILNWLKSLWGELKDLAQTPIEFESLEIEAQIAQFAKLTANLRAVPQLRQQIRQKIDPHTVTLIQVLNEFLTDAKKNLPNGCNKLAVIVDNLDRMVLVKDGDNTNYEEVFVDRSGQLKGLDCHLIYTAPISLLYSKRGTDIRDIYGECLILPMIMVKTPDGAIYQPGLKKVKELISKRVRQIAPEVSPEKDIFDSPETLERLCLMSGGHVRNLLLLTQDAIGRIDELPITKNAVQRAITQARDTYRRTVENSQWHLLAEVSRSKKLPGDDLYRSLMYNRCLLEYKYIDDEGEMQRWYDIHPLIQGIAEFKEAVAKLP